MTDNALPRVLPPPDLAEADWIKATWDMWTVEDGTWKPVVDMAGLVSSLGLAAYSDADKRTALNAFMGLPVWKAAPDGVVQGVLAFLSSPPPADA